MIAQISKFCGGRKEFLLGSFDPRSVTEEKILWNPFEWFFGVAFAYKYEHSRWVNLIAFVILTVPVGRQSGMIRRMLQSGRNDQFYHPEWGYRWSMSCLDCVYIILLLALGKGSCFVNPFQGCKWMIVIWIPIVLVCFMSSLFYEVEYYMCCENKPNWCF